MKRAKEIKTAIIALLAITLLILGVNFLKGSSFFGGDKVYYAYFPNSGGIAAASSVVLNGVGVGKILSVENVIGGSPNRQVKIKFSIQEENIKIPLGSTLEIGSIDLFNKGLILILNPDLKAGYLEYGKSLQGRVAIDMFSQVKAYADPVTARLQGMMEKVDKLVVSFSSFWDTTATTSIQTSMIELKLAITRFGNVAIQAEGLMIDERAKLGNIMSNLESISSNIKKSNDVVTSILGNTKKITDDMVTADFKMVIGDAQQTIKKLNVILEDASKGSGTLGKLLKDETLYNELVKSNKDLQALVIDLQAHPERYVHFSMSGRKVKGLELSDADQHKLHQILDSTILKTK